jgi:hypothetical protein
MIDAVGTGVAARARVLMLVTEAIIRQRRTTAIIRRSESRLWGLRVPLVVIAAQCPSQHEDGE